MIDTDVFIEKHDKVQQSSTDDQTCRCEKVIAALMFWSDAYTPGYLWHSKSVANLHAIWQYLKIYLLPTKFWCNKAPHLHPPFLQLSP